MEAEKTFESNSAASKAPKPHMHSRRRFLRRSLLGLGVSCLLAYGYARFIEPRWLTITRRPLPIKNLPQHWSGRILCQISDLHIGRYVDDDYMIHALSAASKFEPDLVVITGDFMTCHGHEEVDHAVRVVEASGIASNKVIAIPGNHDYGLSWRRSDVADSLFHKLHNLGIRVLRDQTIDLDGFTVAGIEDFWSPHFSQQDAADAIATQPHVVLCHNPDVCDLKIWGEYQGWILSGHTHGGQCKPPFLAPPILPVDNTRYTSGVFDLYDGRWLYINRGLGHALQVRFNAPPEITLFELTLDEAGSTSGVG